MINVKPEAKEEVGVCRSPPSPPGLPKSVSSHVRSSKHVAMQSNATSYSKVFVNIWKAMQSNTKKCIAEQCNVMQSNAKQCKAMYSRKEIDTRLITPHLGGRLSDQSLEHILIVTLGRMFAKIILLVLVDMFRNKSTNQEQIHELILEY